MFFETVPLFLVLFGVDSARILGVFPATSISHQVVFNAYTHELLKHGHEVVVITPNPTRPKDRPADNLTEIDASGMYEAKKTSILGPIQLQAKRGVVSDADSLFEAGIYPGLIQMGVELFKIPEVKRLIEDKSQRFDLVVVEAFMNYHMIVGKIFNAPLILLSSFYGMPESFDVMGSVSVHPKLFPNMHRDKIGDLTFFEKIKEVYQEFKLRYKFRQFEELENALLKENFGPDAPTVDELKENVELLFLNAHPMFVNNRPVPPSVVYLGAIHLQPVKELPQDLKTYLDGSKRGVVYVSLGSNVNPANMHRDMLDEFLHAFGELPYDVLWKFDADNLEKTPKNLKIQKWFPQRDLLTHPNIKAFVTQGGLQSTDEAIDAGVPLVGIPMMGDQWFNTYRYVQLGIGAQLDALTLTSKDLVKAVESVIGDPRYKNNIKKVKAVMNDQPQRPLERAVWWTEHVLRHGGGKHLRAPAANMGWAEYLMLDVFIPVVLVLIVLSITSMYLVYIFVVKLFLPLINKKEKNE